MKNLKKHILIATLILANISCEGYGTYFNSTATNSTSSFSTDGLSGSYAVSFYSGISQISSGEVSIIDSTFKIIFGQLLGGQLSSTGLAVTLFGNSLTLACVNENSTQFSCTATNVAVPNQVIAEFKATFIRTSTTNTVSTINLSTVGTFNANGIEDTSEWPADSIIGNGDVNGDAVNNGPNYSDIMYIRMAKDATNLYLFLKLNGTIGNAVDYRITLSNSSYSEILFNVYPTWNFQYRLNDASHNIITGLVANNPPTSSSAIEMKIPIASLNDGTTVVTSANLTSLSLSVKTLPISSAGSDLAPYDRFDPIVLINF